MRAQRLVADVAACVGFYTRLPVPARLHGVRDFSHAQWAAPVAGALVGALIGLLLLALAATGLEATIAAGIALGTGMLLTGALHEDGVADVADGFGGGRTPDAKLAIMKDSRIGTYGALALVVTVALRWSALTAIAEPAGGEIVLVCIAAHAASRASMPAFMRAIRPARPDGLSAGIGSVPMRSAALALGLGLATLLLAAPLAGVVAGLLLALWFAVLAAVCRHQIGGQTGDVLGTLQQGGEIVVLVTLSTALS